VIYALLIIIVFLYFFGHLMFCALKELSSVVHHLSDLKDHLADLRTTSEDLKDQLADIKTTSDQILEALERANTRAFLAKGPDF